MRLHSFTPCQTPDREAAELNDIRYTTMTDVTYADAVLAMMRDLYATDEPASRPDPARFPDTIRTLLAHPERGRAVLIFRGSALSGYALLIPYFSNEFGGVIVFVDELYVVPEARSTGIGRGLFALVDRERPFDAVAVALEVSRKNTRARKLYESLGLRERSNATLARRLTATAAPD